MLNKAGIKYSKVTRLYYIHFIGGGNFDQMIKVDTSFYKSISLIQIDFFVENDTYDKKIIAEYKNKNPNLNFVSIENIQSQLKAISCTKQPLVLNFWGCHINKEIEILLNSIHEIQSLSFSSCSFGQCSFKNINPSKHFFFVDFIKMYGTL
jgi:hypothetical protein